MTATDVARLAGVSQAAVSLVFSGKASGRVSARKEAAVRRAATQLGYQPNAAARSLRTGAARAVGLVIPDVTNPFFGGVLRGAQRTAQERGYAVLLVDADLHDPDWERSEAVRYLAGGAADGTLLFGVYPGGDGPLSGPAPVVLVEEEAEGWTSICLDVEQGTGALARHLLELGHERFAYMTTPYQSVPFHRRRKTLLDALPQTPREAVTAFNAERARKDVRRLLELDPRPTAIVCDDDLIAAGAILGARDAGLDVPGDVSIVGFDGLDLGGYVTPTLTTAATDIPGFGAAAFELLAERLADPAAPTRRLLHPMRLVTRGSTGPPPKR